MRQSDACKLIQFLVEERENPSWKALSNVKFKKYYLYMAKLKFFVDKISLGSCFSANINIFKLH